MGTRHARREQQNAPTFGHERRPYPYSARKGPPRVGGSPALLTTPTPVEDNVALAESCSWSQSYIGCVMKGTPCNDPCRADASCEAVHHHVCATEAETAHFKKDFPHLKLGYRNPYEYEKQFTCLNHHPYSSKFLKNNASTSGAASSGTSTKDPSNFVARSTASNAARARSANANSSTYKANVREKKNKQCGCGCELDTVANKKN